MRTPTLREVLHGIAVDGAKAAVDASGIHNAIARTCVQRNLVPTGLFGQLVVFGAISALATYARANIDTKTLTGRVVSEIVGDAPSEFVASVIRLSVNKQFKDIVAEVTKAQGGPSCGISS